MAVREFEENGRVYRVMQIAGPEHSGGPLWRMTRTSSNPGEPPFLFCDHAHPTLDEAEACREVAAGELAWVHESLIMQIGHEDYPVADAHQEALDGLVAVRLVQITPDGTPVLSERGRMVFNALED